MGKSLETRATPGWNERELPRLTDAEQDVVFKLYDKYVERTQRSSPRANLSDAAMSVLQTMGTGLLGNLTWAMACRLAGIVARLVAGPAPEKLVARADYDGLQRSYVRALRILADAPAAVAKPASRAAAAAKPASRAAVTKSASRAAVTKSASRAAVAKPASRAAVAKPASRAAAAAKPVSIAKRARAKATASARRKRS